MFNIYCYYDDTRSNQYKSIVKKFFLHDLFTINHEILKKKSNVLIIFNYEIFANKYDLQEQRKYFQKHLN